MEQRPHIRGDTGHEGEAVRHDVDLGLRAVRARVEGDTSADFLARRLERLPGAATDEVGGALQALGSLLRDGATAVELIPSLLRLAGVLEARGMLEEAASVFGCLGGLDSGDPALPLHRARVARKLGRRDEALCLYRRVHDAPGTSPLLDRMADVGEALLASDPVRALGRALRRAVEAGLPEAAAVAQEERARARRLTGDRSGALRDYLVAARRYPDPVDRARVLHEAADLLSAAGDPLAAREILLDLLVLGRAAQRDHALNRLHAISRALGDDLGRRRWKGSRPARLVSLTGAPRVADADTSLAPRVAHWRRRLALSPASAVERSARNRTG